MCNGTNTGNLVPWRAIQCLWEKKASPIKYLIHLIEVYGDGVMGVQHAISAVFDNGLTDIHNDEGRRWV